jgi:hypothetical protein
LNVVNQSKKNGATVALRLEIYMCVSPWVRTEEKYQSAARKMAAIGRVISHIIAGIIQAGSVDALCHIKPAPFDPEWRRRSQRFGLP